MSTPAPIPTGLDEAAELIRDMLPGYSFELSFVNWDHFMQPKGPGVMCRVWQSRDGGCFNAGAGKHSTSAVIAAEEAIQHSMGIGK